jgi:broad specificity phosphatase PhoE
MIKGVPIRLMMIRHGETDSNNTLMTTNTLSEQKEPTLTKIGNTQAYITATHLENRTTLDTIPKYIIVSPQTRCLGTLLPLIPYVKKHNIPIKVFRLIYEKNGYKWITKGDVPGLSCDQIKSFLDYDNIEFIGFDLEHEYGLESIGDFYIRVADFVDYLYTQLDNSNQNIWFYGHSVFISTMINILMGNTTNYDQFYHIANCGISMIDIHSKNKSECHFINSLNHMNALQTGNHTNYQ